MSDPDYDRGYRDFTSSAPFWAAMAILALFLFGAFLYLAPGTDITALNNPPAAGPRTTAPGAATPGKPAGPGNPATPSTTGSGAPSR
jgi:hypothetical protein